MGFEVITKGVDGLGTTVLMFRLTFKSVGLVETTTAELFLFSDIDLLKSSNLSTLSTLGGGPSTYSTLGSKNSRLTSLLRL